MQTDNHESANNHHDHADNVRVRNMILRNDVGGGCARAEKLHHIAVESIEENITVEQLAIGAAAFFPLYQERKENQVDNGGIQLYRMAWRRQNGGGSQVQGVVRITFVGEAACPGQRGITRTAITAAV